MIAAATGAKPNYPSTSGKIGTMKRKKLSLTAKLIILELILLIALVAFLLGGYMIVEA